jgi:hypothetical protein
LNSTPARLSYDVLQRNYRMRLHHLLAPILIVIPAQAGDLAKLVLPGKTFGPDWELTQPNLLGNAAAPNYINRKLPHQPVVMVNIIDFQTPEAARAQWKKKFGGPEAATIVKKVDELPDAYDYVPPAQMKRFMLIGRFWLTVEEVGDKDDRKPFIEKYYEHIMKNAEQDGGGQPATRSESK